MCYGKLQIVVLITKHINMNKSIDDKIAHQPLKLPLLCCCRNHSPQIYFLNSGPLLIVLPVLIVKLLSLLGISSFHFTLKIGCQLVYLFLVQFRFESWMSGLLVEEKENLCSSELPFRRKNQSSCG